MSKDEQGILFFNHGARHCARLAVSLYSLRQNWQGQAVILDTGASGGIVEKIAADRRLAVEVVRIPFVQRPRNSCYVTKAGLWRYSPFREVSLLVDSDTLFAKSPQALLDIAADEKNANIVVTRFSSWISTGELVSGRIERWKGVKASGIDVAKLVEDSLGVPHPAINTGVISWKGTDTQVLRDWERLTAAGWKCPFTDELSAQLLLRKHPHTLLSDRFNCSPIYGQEKEKAVIWHLHGSKHCLRADGRGERGHPIWWPVFQEAWREDIGGIKSWAQASGDDGLTWNLAAGRAG